MRTYFALVLLCSYSAQALHCGIEFNEKSEIKSKIAPCTSGDNSINNFWKVQQEPEQEYNSSEESYSPVVDSKLSNESKSKPDTQLNATNSLMSNQSTDNLNSTCRVQCIFEKLEMVDADGFPEHRKLADFLTQNLTSHDLMDFFLDSTDECFQEMEKEERKDQCSYITKLLVCLAYKGKANCDDWPVGDLPI